MAPSGRTSRLFAFLYVLLMIFFFFVLPSTSGHGHVHRRRRSHGGRRQPVAAAADEAGACAAAVVPNGYPCEEYHVETEDGFILGLQRIPAGRKGNVAAQNRQPVLLQHGVLGDGMTWLISPPEQSLAYILADAGFDVWIANSRGTRWSRSHKTLDPSSAAFWSWTWDDLMLYDLSANVNYVLEKTGLKPHYVGHSQGTLIALASLSENRLVDKLKSAALLSPVAYLGNVGTPLVTLASRVFAGELYSWLGIFGTPEFDPKAVATTDMLRLLCSNPTVNCYDLTSAFTGPNCCLNPSSIEVFLKFEPQPTSTQNMRHLSQGVRDGVVAKFDYGDALSNLLHYGQVTPPLYDMSAIAADFPLFLSYGGRDFLADVRDVGLLLNDLRGHNAGNLTVQFVPDYAHLDFIMAVSAKQVVYDKLVAFFNAHN